MKITADVRFSTVPEWLIYADVSANAVRLYAVLDRHVEQNSGRSQRGPGRSRLAKLMHCSTDTVDRATKELEAIGAVTVVRRRDEDNPQLRDVNEYQLHIMRPGGRTDAATPSRTSAVPLAAPVRQERKPLERKNTSEESKERPRDPVWDGFVAWLGFEPETKDERGKWNAAAKQLRDIGVDDPAEIVRRGRLYERTYQGAARTPNALASRWGEFGRRVERVSPPADQDGYQRQAPPGEKSIAPEESERLGADAIADWRKRRTSRPEQDGSASDQAGDVEAASPAAEERSG